MLELAFLGVVGLLVGSFLNVAVDRLPVGQSLLGPPSHCPACGTRLRPLDLVPVASYLALRGRCRYCRAPIPPRVLLVEALTGALFVLAGWRWGVTPALAPMLVLLSALVALFFADLEHQLLPNAITLPAALALLALAPWSPHLGWEGALARVGQATLGAAVGGGVLLLIAVVWRGGMGMGDVKLGAVVGAGLGPPLAGAALWLAFVGGGVVALALLAARRRGRRDLLPFGTFLAIAAAVAAFTGPPLYRWYLDLLLSP